MRLQKYLAECGVASRRQCELIMESGRVTVNGCAISGPGVKIDPDKDLVALDGRKVVPAGRRYIMLNKPPGFVCTSSDPQGRPKVVDLVPAKPGERLYTIGRLDMNSEGLILFTNDGAFAQQMSHPRHQTKKRYVLWLTSPLSTAQCRQWRAGIEDDGEQLRVLSIKAMPLDKTGHGYEIELGEGRNRHLRRMAAHAGKKVARLQRIAVGNLSLGGLKRSAWRELTEKEIQMLTGRKSK